MYLHELCTHCTVYIYMVLRDIQYAYIIYYRVIIIYSDYDYFVRTFWRIRYIYNIYIYGSIVICSRLKFRRSECGKRGRKSYACGTKKLLRVPVPFHSSKLYTAPRSNTTTLRHYKIFRYSLLSISYHTYQKSQKINNLSQ